MTLEPVRVVFTTMGTVASITIPADEVDRCGRAAVEQAVAGARSELDRLEARFSHYRVDSDIVRWAAGHEVDPSAVVEIEHVLEQCGRLHRDSDGVFRPRDPVSGRLDTAGYVKGYAIGRAAQALRDDGVTAFALGVGGDATFVGRPSPERLWQVAVQHPSQRFGVAAVIPVADGAVATSGRAERGDHIWGLRDTSAVASFTVVGPDIAEADAYATIGFAMGEAGLDWVAARAGYRSVLVRTDGSVVSDAALVSAG